MRIMTEPQVEYWWHLELNQRVGGELVEHLCSQGRLIEPISRRYLRYKLRCALVLI